LIQHSLTGTETKSQMWIQTQVNKLKLAVAGATLLNATKIFERV